MRRISGGEVKLIFSIAAVIGIILTMTYGKEIDSWIDGIQMQKEKESMEKEVKKEYELIKYREYLDRKYKNESFMEF